MTMTNLPRSTALACSAALPRPSIILALREMIARVRRRRSEAIAIAHLKGLPDYLLADIGITRDRVSGVIGDPHVRWQHPPDLW
jgi:uncharacterized protein YjiS (DUF1127 family)